MREDDNYDIDLEKTIFWVGAGASIAYPCKLPGGRELTEYYLTKSLGKPIAAEFLKIWNKTNKSLRSIYKRDMPLPRLEIVIGCIDEIDREGHNLLSDYGYLSKQFRDERFISAFESYKHMKPNINHILLNYFLEEHRSIIITANFDLCIENASNSGSSYEMCEKHGIQAMSNGESTVYHYHGIAGDVDTLGATISNMRGLNDDFGAYILTLLENGYSIIPIGFSMSDYFDVTPFFAQLKEKQYSGKGIFIQHNDMSIDLNRVRADATEMLKCFKDNIFVFSDTTKFLYTLLPVEQRADILKKESQIKEHSEWKIKFEEIAKQKDSNEVKNFYKGLYALKIFSFHNINISQSVIKELGYQFKNEFYEALLECFDKNIDISRHIETYFLGDYNKSVLSDLIGFSEANNADFKKRKRVEEKFFKAPQSMYNRIAAQEIRGKICNFIKENKPDVEYFDTLTVYSIVLAVEDCIYQILQKRDEGLCQTLIESIDRMLILPYHKHEYISYYLMLCRYKNFLKTFISKGTNEIEHYDEVMNIALEISAIGEVIYNIEYIAYINLVKYYYIGDKYYYNEAIKYQRSALDLRIITGKKKSCHRARVRVHMFHVVGFISKISLTCSRKILWRLLPKLNLETEKQDIIKVKQSIAYKELIKERVIA